MNGSTCEKLERWIDRLGKDKTLPWIGLGLIRDLEEAVVELRGIEMDRMEEREYEWIDL